MSPNTYAKSREAFPSRRVSRKDCWLDTIPLRRHAATDDFAGLKGCAPTRYREVVLTPPKFDY